MKVTDKF